MTNSDIAAAFRQALDRDPLGIEQVDAELSEDGRCIVLYGHTSDPSVTYVASVPVPAAIAWHRA